MKSLLAVLSTSVGKKFLMAVTGLMLCGFLIVHLAGNLLLYADEDGKSYNEYAHALHSRKILLKVLEVGLAGLFFLHISLAFKTVRENRAARKVRYYTRQSKIQDRHSTVKPDTWMFLSGAVILGFLILHLVDFTFLLRTDVAYADFENNQAGKAAVLLRTPLTAIVYTVGCIILGIHLSHGISSAFQSLGVNHPKYQPLIHWGGILFAVLIGIGFASFPVVYFMFSS